MSEFRDREGDREQPSETLASVLTHRHRRRTLWCLAESDETLHLADLARDIARSEAATEEKLKIEDEARRIYMQLYHVHLPKLAETGPVSFDAESKTASLMRQTDRVESYLEDFSAPR